jgi:hypothetical protein
MRYIPHVLSLGLLSVAPVFAQTAPPEKPIPPAYPTPHLYALSWELKFEHTKPQRLVVDGKAYWYLTYMVTNKTDRDQQWLPTFEMLTDKGNVVEGNGKDIPSNVFETIKTREKKTLLEPADKIAGTIRVGEAEAREGAAIWAEPDPRMGRFSIFVQGLSGEVRQFKKVDGALVELKQGADYKGVKPDDLVILRKTLQLNYWIKGDEVYPGEDEVNQTAEVWVMR